MARITMSGPQANRAEIKNPEETNVVPNSYLVKYKENVSASDKDTHEDAVHQRAVSGGSRGIVGKWDFGAFSGYEVEIAPGDLNVILEAPVVDYVEKNGIYEPTVIVAQAGAEWGLAWISNQPPALGQPYIYDNSAGNGANVYVIDTGIRITHNEFAGGRARWGTNLVPATPNIDQTGHGTHVAGTIAGATFGVAKRATVIAVKVFAPGVGNAGLIIRGMNWVSADAGNQANRAVVNMSLGGPRSAMLNYGVAQLAQRGMTVVAAAGNANVDANTVSPASAPDALTVGASDQVNQRWAFSNHGPRIDVWAPGVNIRSASHANNAGNVLMDGTSMAAPHVAGIAAYFIAFNRVAGRAVKQRILARARAGARGGMIATNMPPLGPGPLAYNA